MPQGWDGGTKGWSRSLGGVPKSPSLLLTATPHRWSLHLQGRDPALAGHREAKQPPSRKTAGAGIFSAKPGTPAQTARRGAGLPFFIILIFMVNKKEIFSGSSPGQAEGRRRKNKHFLAVVVPFWRR